MVKPSSTNGSAIREFCTFREWRDNLVGIIGEGRGGLVVWELSVWRVLLSKL
jgi:hypothetical protein